MTSRACRAACSSCTPRRRCARKNAYRRAQQLKRSSAKDPGKHAARLEQIRAAHADYLSLCKGFLERAALTRIKLQHGFGWPAGAFSASDDFIAHAERQIDQVRRRVFQGERIPHGEKVFSIFEPHTEWISI
jgi:hypothetical protein